MLHHAPTRVFAAASIALWGLAACGGDDDTASPTTAPAAEETTTTAAAEPLTIVVTNDDGIGAPGIDVMVTALRRMEDIELHVVAPAENQSGSSDTTTPGGAPFDEGETAGGVAGTVVDGYPADTIGVALDDLGLEPDVVVSGINEGQNTGTLAFVSGTVGAARTAAREGVPAVAGSAGFGEGADYESAAALVVAWLEQHRADLLAGDVPTDTVTSLNVPDCVAGTFGGEVLEVPLASVIPAGVDPFTSDCTAPPAARPADDVAAVAAGYAAETLVPIDAP